MFLTDAVVPSDKVAVSPLTFTTSTVLSPIIALTGFSGVAPNKSKRNFLSTGSVVSSANTFKLGLSLGCNTEGRSFVNSGCILGYVGF